MPTCSTCRYRGEAREPTLGLVPDGISSDRIKPYCARNREEFASDGEGCPNWEEN